MANRDGVVRSRSRSPGGAGPPPAEQQQQPLRGVASLKRKSADWVADQVARMFPARGEASSYANAVVAQDVDGEVLAADFSEEDMRDHLDMHVFGHRRKFRRAIDSWLRHGPPGEHPVALLGWHADNGSSSRAAGMARTPSPAVRREGSEPRGAPHHPPGPLTGTDGFPFDLWVTRHGSGGEASQDASAAELSALRFEVRDDTTMGELCAMYAERVGGGSFLILPGGHAIEGSARVASFKGHGKLQAVKLLNVVMKPMEDPEGAEVHCRIRSTTKFHTLRTAYSKKTHCSGGAHLLDLWWQRMGRYLKMEETPEVLERLGSGMEDGEEIAVSLAGDASSAAAAAAAAGGGDGHR